MTVSVLIATRNRPDDLMLCLESLLAMNYADYEIVVCDQSTTTETEQAIHAVYGNIKCLRYLRLDAVGKSNALNVLIHEAKGEILALTDDDTVVPQDWLANIVTAFAQHPKPDILFGPVYPNPELTAPSDVYVPAYIFSVRRQLKPGDISGMGANMAMTRAAAEAVGNFDVLLGPGAPMYAAEEGDFVYRAHLSGLCIVHEPTIGLIHRAWRDKSQWDHVFYCYGVGDAAFALKHLRCGDWAMTSLLVSKPCRIFLRMCRRLVRAKANSEKKYLAGYLKGLRLSLRYRVDVRTRLYVSGFPPGKAVTQSIGINR